VRLGDPNAQLVTEEAIMTTARLIAFTILSGMALSGCQTPQARQAQLATLCADPVNRQPGNFYFNECQSIKPSTSRQLQKDYTLGAPTGDD
jgi:hypothetical protein